MNEPEPPGDPRMPASREEMFSALFANMIIQQSNMALMFLGKVPHPETGEHIQDVESAKILIDQLEMLAAKTKGNLDKREENLLKQALAAVRMAFVDVVEGPETAAAATPLSPHSAEAAANVAPPPSPEKAAEEAKAPPSSAAPADAESRKKFSKKY